VLEELAHALPVREQEPGVQLDERLEDEPSLREPRVRNREPRLVDHLLSVEQEIEVDRARAISRPGPLAPEPALDAEETSEELERSVDRLDRTGRIQEARLVQVADGIGLAEGRHGADAEARLLAEEPNGLSEIPLPISEVRAERYVCANHSRG
jgi:hypothetical protein